MTSTKRPYDPALGRLPRALIQAARTMRNRVDTILAECGLSQSQYEVLQVLDHQPGVTATDVSRILGSSPQNLTPLMYRMEDAGLITRHWTPGSGNRLTTNITTDGLAALRRAQSRIRVLDRSIRTSLGPDLTSSLVEELFALGNFLSNAG